MPAYESELELEEELASCPQSEFEEELEGEFEGEFEGELESEFEYEGEFEDEFEGEFEGELEGEYFSFKNLFKKVGGFVKKAAPILRRVAKVAAPVVGTAIGGPVGGFLGKAASSMLESEYEGEFEGEYEEEMEAEAEEEAPRPLTVNEALAEFMADAAATTPSQGEAEALIGAATVTTLSPADRRALGKLLPSLVRGTSVLTRLLRRHRATKPTVRVIPSLVRRTANTLKKRAAAGKPATRAVAAKVMAHQTRKVLGSAPKCAKTMARSVRSARVAKKSVKMPRRRVVAG